MSNLDPTQFPTIFRGQERPIAVPIRPKKYNTISNTYGKPPRANDELILCSISRFCIGINALSYSFEDISSHDHNSYRFKQTFRNFASDAARFYRCHGACSVHPHQKAGWVEVGFRNLEYRNQALSIPFIHESQTFQPIRAYHKLEIETNVTFDGVPVGDKL
jgi:hypothetical protein